MSEQITLVKDSDLSQDAPDWKWKNVSHERIEDPNKAHEMAIMEDKFRTLIAKQQGQLAVFDALNPGTNKWEERHAISSTLERNQKNGPIAVEQAGVRYDEGQRRKAKAELDDRNSHRPEWVNISTECVIDPEKAAHEAFTENAWRDSIDRGAQKAKKLAESGDPLGSIAAQVVNENNRQRARVHGPRAVEKIGRDYDALHNPDLPPPEL